MTTEIHSVLFNRENVTTTQARKWLRDHHLVPIKPVHKTLGKLRYRIRDPALYKDFITRVVSPNISIVLGVKAPQRGASGSQRDPVK